LKIFHHNDSRGLVVGDLLLFPYIPYGPEGFEKEVEEAQKEDVIMEQKWVIWYWQLPPRTLA
jgi:hypothetical protein